MARSNDKPVWYSTVAGLCAVLVGIGLARFAYSPLIPALIEARWFSASEAAYLGAANLAGYLVGALLSRVLVARIAAPILLRSMMLLAAVTFIASAEPVSFAWFSAWRFLSGFSGAVLLVVGMSAVLRRVPAKRIGLVGGVIIAGAGFGVVASGTLVPHLLDFGLAQTWLAFGVLALILTGVAWFGWLADSRAADNGAALPASPGRRLAASVRGLYVEYGLNAMALVPHMVFLVDFIARGLGEGLSVGAFHWVLFGLGAMVGPSLLGAIADRIGFARALPLAYVVQAACIALLALDQGPAALAVSSVVIGAFVPGIVPLVLGRVHDLIEAPAARQAAWSAATVAFASGQAAGAYAFSYLFERGGGYTLLFGIGAGLLVLALVINLASRLVAGKSNDWRRRAA